MMTMMVMSGCGADRGGGGLATDGGLGADGAVGADGGVGGGIPLDQLFARTAHAVCDNIFRCRRERDAQVQRFYVDAMRCSEIMERSYANGAAGEDLMNAVAANKIHYDPVAAERCLAALEGDCSAVSDPSCLSIYLGTAPIGGECFRTEDCAGDAWCDNVDPNRADQLCPGTCREGVALGAACLSSRECTRSAMGVPNCALQVCTVVRRGAEIADGGMCGRTMMSSLVFVDDYCAAGSWCDKPIGDERGVCRAVPAPGAACMSSSDVCAAGEECSASMCRPVPSRSTIGDECGATPQDFCNFYENLICVDRTCQLAGDGSLGAGCTGADTSCDAGLFCDQMTTKCAPKLTAGAACGRDEACESGSCEGGQCLARFCH